IMSQIRQGERDYFVNHNAYFTITSGNIDSALPTSVSAGTPTPASAGVDVNAGVAQYFSNATFTVTANGTLAWDTNITPGNPGAPVDFLISVDGTTPPNVACTGGSTDCAVHNTDVSTFRLEMDNSGRVFVSYGSGAANTWSAW
ncbi:MAG: hypothetical protein PHN57_00940, partial [Candidatus Omnitrophica bacterium]|nr:hypothetical protein [Candidatus Omnitrophota bacterium]